MGKHMTKLQQTRQGVTRYPSRSRWDTRSSSYIREEKAVIEEEARSSKGLEPVHMKQ